MAELTEDFLSVFDGEKLINDLETKEAVKEYYASLISFLKGRESESYKIRLTPQKETREIKITITLKGEDYKEFKQRWEKEMKLT